MNIMYSMFSIHTYLYMAKTDTYLLLLDSIHRLDNIVLFVNFSNDTLFSGESFYELNSPSIIYFG